MKKVFWSTKDMLRNVRANYFCQCNNQFVLEEHLEIICSEDGEEMEEFMLLARDEFISAMLRIHAANSRRKWRLLIKNAIMVKSDLTPSNLVSNILKILGSG